MDVSVFKKYPFVGACGLSCGLCPRYHTSGSSRCPGCCGPDFRLKHPSCGFITCCVKNKKLETCALCPEWRTCEKVNTILESSKHRDSFISYKPLLQNYLFIEENGIEAFVDLENRRQALLRDLLDNYNDGRSKNFYCLSCQLLPLEELEVTIKAAESRVAEIPEQKEKALAVRSALNGLAGTLQIDLKLRR